MHKYDRFLYWLLGVIILSRVVPMVFLPFTDPTEARYADIARIMAETGDWITPYFNYGVPFWGKPPLSFWSQAISFKLFGINEFAPRLPSWLVTLAIVGLVYRVVCAFVDRSTAILACIIFFSFMLSFALSGAVLTDTYLTLSVTLSLVAFHMVVIRQPGYWGYGFFVGLVIGLLSKGPIAVVLILGPIGLWLLLDRKRWQTLTLLPWIPGLAITVLLSLPWYIAAEIKTPGFLKYFIIGEHFYRFVDPGWNGDLYGSAHRHVKGFIWVLWLAASFPWGIIALIAVAKRLARTATRQPVLQAVKDEATGFYVLWALFTPVFFTIAGNVLWTYLLPCLPALAILIALYFRSKWKDMTRCQVRRVTFATLVTPSILLVATAYLLTHHQQVPTEKYLVDYFKSVSAPMDKLYFINDLPFSARYYMQGRAARIELADLNNTLAHHSTMNVYLAVPKSLTAKVAELATSSTGTLYSSYDFDLLKIQFTGSK